MRTAYTKAKAAISIAFFGIIALTLSGCTALGGGSIVPLPAPAVITASTTIDDKLMYSAEALYNVPAQAYVAADSRQLMSASLKATVKPKMLKLRSLLLDARKAYAASNATSFKAAYDAMKSLRDEVHPLIPATK
jgi:hypothetical protein